MNVEVDLPRQKVTGYRVYLVVAYGLELEARRIRRSTADTAIPGDPRAFVFLRGYVIRS